MGAQASCAQEAACCPERSKNAGEVLSGVVVEPPTCRLDAATVGVHVGADPQPVGGQELSFDKVFSESSSLHSLRTDRLGAALSRDASAGCRILAYTSSRPSNSSEPRATSSMPSSSEIRASAALNATVDSLGSMQPVEDFTLRAIPARKALAGLGRMFRAETADAFRQSRDVGEIAHFWSHSWSAPVWHKILTLLIFYNGTKSMVVGLLTAGLAAACWPEAWAPHPAVTGLVAMYAGLFGSFLALGWWPCADLVFLDKACIAQDDAEKKRNGILSIGFIIKKSRAMVVIWEGSYLTRLWCVFEFAGRLKAREAADNGELVILPCQDGPIVLIGTLAFVFVLTVLRLQWMLSGGPLKYWVDVMKSESDLLKLIILQSVYYFFSLVLVAPFFRVHLQMLRSQVERVQTFSMDDSQCFCCTNGHRHPETGQELACDRAMIEDAVIEWFGSKTAFGDYVKTRVWHHIPTRYVLPYRFIVIFSMPFLWEAAGASSWLLRRGSALDALSYLCHKLLMVLLIAPVQTNIVMHVMSMCHRGPSSGWCGNVVAILRLSCLCSLAMLPVRLFWMLCFPLLGEWAAYPPLVLVLGGAAVLSFGVGQG